MTIADPLDLVLLRAHGQVMELKCEYAGPAEGKLQHAWDDECLACGAEYCPGKEPLHFHHDGCPHCYYEERCEKCAHTRSQHQHQMGSGWCTDVDCKCLRFDE